MTNKEFRSILTDFLSSDRFIPVTFRFLAVYGRKRITSHCLRWIACRSIKVFCVDIFGYRHCDGNQSNPLKLFDKIDCSRVTAIKVDKIRRYQFNQLELIKIINSCRMLNSISLNNVELFSEENFITNIHKDVLFDLTSMSLKKICVAADKTLCQLGEFCSNLTTINLGTRFSANGLLKLTKASEFDRYFH